jgi:hypothetical protein
VPDEGVIAELETTRTMAIIIEKKQAFILDGKYSIAKNELRYLIGRAESTTAQDAKKLAPVIFPLRNTVKARI